MIPLAELRDRRARLLDGLERPVLLMAGGQRSRNYSQNVYPYRADSNFLYFIGAAEPGAAALFDPADGTTTLFLPARTADEALWHGPQAPFDEVKSSLGVEAIEPLEELDERVTKKLAGRQAWTIAIADERDRARAEKLVGAELDYHDPDGLAPASLRQRIADLRNRKSAAEVDAMRATAKVTAEAFEQAMGWTRAGVLEHEIAGRAEGVFARHGCVPAYNSICSVRGEVLHNTGRHRTLRDGDLMLLDAGAEGPYGYCSDVTRTWPVNGRFEGVQATIYDIVLAAETAAIDLVKPGTRYRDVHLKAARVLTEGLVELGVLRGDVDGLVEQGAQGLFFPHGVGHLIGLDVHDMEGFGDLIGYAPGRERSDQFGLAMLRLDLDLEPGFCVTIEPGIYFVPGILGDPEFRSRFADAVDFGKADEFLTANDGRGFGGVRIEDDVLCVAGGADVLTEEIPKARDAVEAAVGGLAAAHA